MPDYNYTQLTLPQKAAGTDRELHTDRGRENDMHRQKLILVQAEEGHGQKETQRVTFVPAQ